MANLVAAVADRLEERLGTARTIYQYAVPADPVPRYLVVRANTGETQDDNLGSRVDGRVSAVWVTSVSRSTSARTAGAEALWGATKAVDALTVDWRPEVGAESWQPEHAASQPIQRDDDLPDFVMYAVDLFLIKYVP